MPVDRTSKLIAFLGDDEAMQDSLRDLGEDIPVLVTHFAKMFRRRMGKQVDNIPPEIMDAFQWYCWPGNIRERQNLLEHAVILSRDGVLPDPLHKKPNRAHDPQSASRPKVALIVGVRRLGSRFDLGNT